jgi:hypothetical protein
VWCGVFRRCELRSCSMHYDPQCHLRWHIFNLKFRATHLRIASSAAEFPVNVTVKYSAYLPPNYRCLLSWAASIQFTFPTRSILILSFALHVQVPAFPTKIAAVSASWIQWANQTDHATECILHYICHVKNARNFTYKRHKHPWRGANLQKKTLIFLFYQI